MRRVSEWWYGTVARPLTYGQALARAGLILLGTFIGLAGVVYFTLFVWLWPQ